MKDLIIIIGPPGSGKSTLAKKLRKRFKSPEAHFGYIRNLHMHDKGQRAWTHPDKKEVEMSFKNLIYILKNYLDNGYKNIIVHDLGYALSDKLVRKFTKSKFVIFNLMISDKTLAQRIKKRDSGWQNIKLAVKWNQTRQARKLLKNEVRINAELTPQEIFNQTLKYI